MRVPLQEFRIPSCNIYAFDKGEIASHMLRRTFCLSTLIVGATAAYAKTARLAIAEASTPTTQPRPNPSTFQSGDFIWPKTPGKFVPYDSSRFQTDNAEEKQWYTERNAFIASVNASPNSSAPEKEAAESVGTLDFKEFRARYLADKIPGTTLYGGNGSPLYVGHVGILRVESDGPYVIEAVTDPGHQVRRISYQEWLKERPDDLIWHGRLKGYDTSTRERISSRAMSQIGKPYGFWNFNLDDDKEFYCSKLVWQCIYRELNIAVDGNANPQRNIWFSPKQLMNCRTIEMLNVPGNYGRS